VSLGDAPEKVRKVGVSFFRQVGEAHRFRTRTLAVARLERVTVETRERVCRLSRHCYSGRVSALPNIHEDFDEAIYVLEGMLQMEVGGQAISATPGAVVLAPKGTLHALASAGSDAARFLVILSPPGYEGFWREMGELRAAGGPDGAPPSAELVLALRRKYHLATGGEVRRFD